MIKMLYPALRSSLLAYWQMNETVVPSTRVDVFRLTNATDNNNVGVAAGKFSNAAVFDLSIPSYLSALITTRTSLANNKLSISMWIKLGADPAGAEIVFGSLNEDLSEFQFIVVVDTSGNISSYARDTSGNAVQRLVTTAVDSGSFTHYAVVFEPTNVVPDNQIKTYVNGVLSGGSIGTPLTDFAEPGLNNIYFSHPAIGTNCTVDEVGMWGRLLTKDEINRLYSAGLGKRYSF